jgi:hypothetical protein
MGTWEVKKYRKANGDIPFDKWYESKVLTVKDRAAIDKKVSVVELAEELQPETVKAYQTTKLHEFKISGDKKKLRPLCTVVGKTIIILCGAIEKGGKIPAGTLISAENLRTDYVNGAGVVEDYFED